MLKKLGWLAKLIAAGLLLSFLSIWTTGYIVTSYVDTLLKQFNLPIEVKPMAMSGVWGKLWGADPLMTTDIADKEGASEEEGAVTEGIGASSEEDSTTGVAESPLTGAESGDQGEPPLAVDAFGEIAEPPLTDIGIGGGVQADSGAASEEGGVQEGAVGGDGTETAMTTDELADVKNEMSDEDKERLFALLMTKLPQESWQTISEFVENGLSEQELTDIQQIMAQHLDKSEYEQMMDILKKY
ncbi:hypothetical protein [Paenibacillus sp. sgz302251]|uniref:hypothetical protein n=1 Tax=Paenibacillus sp. sgz302251 TaxID=3414493 RepID=UPI003C7AA06F